MTRPKIVPDQKNALLLLMIDLAVKIVTGETSVEKELADGYDAWSFQEASTTIPGLDVTKKRDRSQLKSKIKEFFVPTLKGYNNSLLLYEARLRSGTTRDELIDEVISAKNAKAKPKVAPAKASNSEREGKSGSQRGQARGSPEAGPSHSQ